MIKKTLQRIDWLDKLKDEKAAQKALKIINCKKVGEPLDDFLQRFVPYEALPYYVWCKYPDYDKKLHCLDVVLEAYGIETIRLSEHDSNYRVTRDTIALYLNTGDSYTPTIIYRYDIVKKWDVLSVGDLQEILERKGYKLR